MTEGADSAPARVVVYGSSGAGKSRLAAELARRTGGDHVEIDLLAFDAAGDHVDPSELCRRFAAATPPDGRWVVEGMHRDQLEAALAHADLFVWLDVGRRTIARHLVARTLRHLVTRRPRHGRAVTVASVLRADARFIAKSVRRVPDRRRHAQRLAALAAAAHGGPVVHLTSSRDALPSGGPLRATGRRPPRPGGG